MVGKSWASMLLTEVDLSVTTMPIFNPEAKRKFSRDFSENTSISAEQLTYNELICYRKQLLMTYCQIHISLWGVISPTDSKITKHSKLVVRKLSS